MNKIELKFNRVVKMIEKYPEVFTYGSGASEAAIREAEEQLNVTFPPMYRKFLESYGYLVVDEDALWGISPDSSEYDVVIRTNRFKEALTRLSLPPLPSPLFCIRKHVYDDEGLIFTLDTSEYTFDGLDVKVRAYPAEITEPEYISDSFTEEFYIMCSGAITKEYSDETSNTKDRDDSVEGQKTLTSSSSKESYDMAKPLIFEHPELSELGSGCTDQHIKAIENKLGVTFKGSYVTFLKEFGGGLFGENLFFSLEDEELIEINRQLHHPTDYEYGLAEHLIAVYYDDLEDFYACLDFDNEVNGEPSVVYRNTNVPEEDYDPNERLKSFGEFLHYIIQDTIHIESRTDS